MIPFVHGGGGAGCETRNRKRGKENLTYCLCRGNVDVCREKEIGEKGKG